MYPVKNGGITLEHRMKKFNIKRGLMRLWTFLSCIWIIFAFFAIIVKDSSFMKHGLRNLDGAEIIILMIILLTPPIVLLLFGISFNWIYRGFNSDDK